MSYYFPVKTFQPLYKKGYVDYIYRKVDKMHFYSTQSDLGCVALEYSSFVLDHTGTTSCYTEGERI